ncbi:MAG: hypothetical protein FWD82_05230 [Defluviitaleaceae bacterium]|nr:hypothetical protein [Defluviitaleaceae bacterium]
MKIPKEIYNYIEYELSRYDLYKEELELEREKILESGYQLVYDDKVFTTNISKPTEKKAITLLFGVSILGLERIIRAIESAIKTKEHEDVFKEYYRKKRRDIYLICEDLSITRSSFFRYRNEIVTNMAIELGILKAGISLNRAC